MQFFEKPRESELPTCAHYTGWLISSELKLVLAFRPKFSALAKQINKNLVTRVYISSSMLEIKTNNVTYIFLFFSPFDKNILCLMIIQCMN